MDAQAGLDLAWQVAEDLMRELKLTAAQRAVWRDDVRDAALRGQRSVSSAPVNEQVQAASRWASQRISELQVTHPVEEASEEA